MDAKLIIVGGKTNKSHVKLRLPTIIGRSRSADLTVSHPMVSRQHCELFEVDGRIRIRDLGSLNGTIIEDQQIQEADLLPNAEFTVGPLTFQAVYDYKPPVPEPPVPEPPVPEPPVPEPPVPEPPVPEVVASSPDEPLIDLDVIDATPLPLDSVTDDLPEALLIDPKAELPDFAAWDAAKQPVSPPPVAKTPRPEPFVAPLEPLEPIDDEPTAQFHAFDLLPPQESPSPDADEPPDQESRP